MGKIIRTTLYVLTALIPLLFTTANYELFEFPKFLLLVTATGIITIAWIVDAVLTKKLTIIRPSPMKTFVFLQWAVVGVLATQIIATFFSIHPYTSFWGYYSRFHQGLLTTICYTILFFAAVNWLDKKSVHKIINISIKTSIFVSIIAILEHYNISLTCMLMTALSHFKDASSPFIATTACWGASTNPLNRSFATIGQPNWLAAYIIPHMFLMFAMLRKRRSILGYAAIAIYCVAVIVTKSRSGLLALAISYVAYWITAIRATSWNELKKSFGVTTSIVILALALFGTPYTPAITSMIKDVQTRQTTPSVGGGTALETGGTESGDIRKIVWSGALNLISNHLLVGTGPETFAYTYYWERPVAHNYTSEWDFLYNKAHNEYLNMAATTGLIGVTAYLIWHLAIGALSLSEIPTSKKTNKEDENNLRTLLPTMAASVISFGVTNFFGFSVIPVYYTIVLISALPLALGSDHDEQPTIPAALYGYAASAILIFMYFVPVKLFLADYYYTLGKTNNIIPYLQKAVSLRPAEDLFHSALAEAYATQVEPEDRERALSESAITKKHNPYHLNYYKSRVKVDLALAATDPAYYAQAASEFVRARQLAPTDPKLAYNLGLIYSRLGDIDKAETQINQAIELKKDYQEAYYALTLLYEQTKQVDKIPELLGTARSNLATYSGLLQEKITQYIH